MSKHVALTPEDHQDIRLRTQRSAALGDAVMSCVTFPSEFRSLQNHYPVLFQPTAERDTFHPVALFGFEAGENLFLKEDRWDARYVPLAIDIQPFLIGLSQDPQGDHKVHIDMDSPRITKGDGIRLFDQFGKPTDYLEDMAEKLGSLHDGYQRTSDYIAALQKYDLLEPFVLEVELNDGSKNRLVGFHTINEENLYSLDAAALGELNAQRFLLPTYMAVASLSNLVNLIDRRNAKLGDV